MPEHARNKYPRIHREKSVTIQIILGREASSARQTKEPLRRPRPPPAALPTTLGRRVGIHAVSTIFRLAARPARHTGKRRQRGVASMHARSRVSSRRASRTPAVAAAVTLSHSPNRRPHDTMVGRRLRGAVGMAGISRPPAPPKGHRRVVGVGLGWEGETGAPFAAAGRTTCRLAARVYMCMCIGR